jgi:glucan endo-1,3-beta-D-glucosidase
MHMSTLAVGSALAAGVSAQNYLGFNSGATLANREAKFKSDFLAEFNTAQNLRGAPGTFNAVRLYTNIQAYSETDPIQAFEAAIETETKILLGIWASGTTNIDKEITALKAAISSYGSDFTDLVIGMSIGSEDLYRVSETGIENESGPGASADTLVKFISDYKEAFEGTPLADVPIGHVDTWDAWTNSSNSAIIQAVDWLGVDEYPYYENGKNNTIQNSGQLFDIAFDKVAGVAGGKPVWVTETGWPSSGDAWDLAEAGIDEAEYYWQEVGCRQLFNKVPTFWYNLRDSNPDNDMKFAITEGLSTSPLFNLTCPTTFQTPDQSEEETTTTSPSGTASGTSAAPTTSSTGSSESGSGSGSGSGSSNGSSGSGSEENTGSGSGSSTGSGSEETTGTEGDETTQTGEAEGATTPSGAVSGKSISYAAIALVAGAVAALF